MRSAPQRRKNEGKRDGKGFTDANKRDEIELARDKVCFLRTYTWTQVLIKLIQIYNSFLLLSTVTKMQIEPSLPLLNEPLRHQSLLLLPQGL